MSLETLDDVFLHDLKDLYDAEKRLVKALPKMARKANDETLQAAFEEHLAVTEKQVERLEKIFDMLDKPQRGKRCPAMEGLVKEGSEIMEEGEPSASLDAALIGAAQKVEHYEIAGYGTMIAHARLLGLEKAVTLLEETLAEEKEADEKLTEIASQVNMAAMNGADRHDARDAGV